MRIIFITGNKVKLEEAKKILGSDYEIINENLDLIEIQSIDNKEVIKHKIEEAYQIAEKKYGSDINVMCEDTGLQIKNLNKFPGALIKFYKENVGLKQIVEFSSGSKATAISVIGFKNKSGTFIFEGKKKGHIIEKENFSLPPDIDQYNCSWDYMFIPNYPKKYSEYSGKTYSEIPKDIKNSMSHRYRVFKKFIAFLEKNGTQ